MLHEQLRTSPEAFEVLATSHSACPSRAAGGNLGQITPGTTAPEFEKALTQLEQGQISAPVQTRYGFHVIRLDRHVPGAQLPFELVHARIAAYLAERSRRLATAQYIARLAAGALLSGVHLPRPDELWVH